ncbi:MAG: glycosyltransferase [Acidimicrobiales bacterium]
MKGWVALSALAYAGVGTAVLRAAPLDRRAGPSPLDPPGSMPSISVVVPARNEADKIGLLLGDLRRAIRPGMEAEVIVVDDGSDDGTGPLAASLGATVLGAGDRPAGWNPKAWALSQGAARAANDVLVFLDADVRLAPDALDTVAAELAGAGGLVSVAPHHRAVGPFEALAAGPDTVTVAGGGPGLRPGPHAAGAVGSCLAIARADYHRIGGHGATPATIVDDIDLARAARRHGLPVSLRRGGSVVWVRSHPDGLGAVVEGFSKNLAAGLTRTPAPSTIAVSAWIAALVWPLVLAARGRWRGALLAWAAAALQTWWITRRVGRYQPLVTSAGAPLLGVFLTALTARSVVARSTGRPIRWKGRPLDARGLEVGSP